MCKLSVCDQNVIFHIQTPSLDLFVILREKVLKACRKQGRTVQSRPRSGISPPGSGWTCLLTFLLSSAETITEYPILIAMHIQDTQNAIQKMVNPKGLITTSKEGQKPVVRVLDSQPKGCGFKLQRMQPTWRHLSLPTPWWHTVCISNPLSVTLDKKACWKLNGPR